MSDAELIGEMIRLLTPPGSWCQGALARNAAGESVPAHAEDAVAWSMDGAAERGCEFGGTQFGKIWASCLPRAGWPVYSATSWRFNDRKRCTHTAVLERLRIMRKNVMRRKVR